MSKQYIYIARHGETVGNAADIVQTAVEELTSAGHLQAQRLATRASALKFSRLLASDMTRAQQTAQYIAEATNISIETVPDAREFENPSRFQECARQNPDFLEHVMARVDSFAADNWDFKDSDEESFREFHARAERVREMFAASTDNFFMVTHGHFLRFFAASLLCGPSFSPKVWHLFGNRMLLSNTGITVFVRDLNDNRWYLERWNDTAHFAE